MATTYTYDNIQRLTGVTHKLGTTVLDGATYTFDAAGNRKTRTDQRTSTTLTYGYDNIYQLLSAKQGTTTKETYTYDRVGNRLSSLGVTPYVNNTSNELTSIPGTTYSYDNNGNMATKTDATGVTTYTWDVENRLVAVALPGSGGSVTYKYDPFGRRVQKTFTQGSVTTTVNYVYDGANLIEEVDANGVVLARYTQGAGIDEPLMELRSATTSYYQADGLGSITSVTTTAGALANTYTYDSYGKLSASTGTVVNPFRYTGREFDSETGLYYYRARYYGQDAGRFLSEDPIRFTGGANFYRYVSNSPTTFIDPAGLVELQYQVNYQHRGFWESLWEAGATRRHYRWSGICIRMCDDKWKLNLSFWVTFDVSYSSNSNRKHEEAHVGVAEAFFNRNRSHYEALELAFGSEAACKDYLLHRLDREMFGLTHADDALLEEEQNAYDGFWGWLFNHSF